MELKWVTVRRVKNKKIIDEFSTVSYVENPVERVENLSLYGIFRQEVDKLKNLKCKKKVIRNESSDFYFRLQGQSV